MQDIGFFRAKKLNYSGVWLKAAKHNKREIKRELTSNSHIVKELSHKNFSLLGPSTAQEVADKANGLIK